MFYDNQIHKNKLTSIKVVVILSKTTNAFINMKI